MHAWSQLWFQHAGCSERGCIERTICISKWVTSSAVLPRAPSTGGSQTRYLGWMLEHFHNPISSTRSNMKAIRVSHFGDVDAISYEEIARPAPEEGQVLVHVHAAGVGPWDAWVRAGKSVLPQPLPLTLGSEISGVVDAVGVGGSRLQVRRRCLRGDQREIHWRLCRVCAGGRQHDRAEA